MQQQSQAIPLSQLARRITSALAAAPDMRDVWVTAETSDVRVVGGNCYMELVEKDAGGRQTARMRATIWSSRWYELSSLFVRETGRNLCSDIKVMVRATVSYHPVYGLSANITDIDCTYTVGDLLRRRNEMIKRLTDEGIIDDNRNMQFRLAPQRVAVVSAEGAAGYGDFMKHLYGNTSRLRFYTELFPAVMQGDRTAPTIIQALDAINAREREFDVVVIIRGGGATTDLQAYDNYELAANIAQFPLPVIIGIGHERDITLLDYVARLRVKTPTGAADFLIEQGERLLSYLQSTASAIVQAVSDRLGGCREQLAGIQGRLPALCNAAVMRAHKQLTNARIVLTSTADRRLHPQLARLDGLQRSLVDSVRFAVDRQKQRIDSMGSLIDALSPEATLRRGYSITRVAGRAITDPHEVNPGEVIETILAHGTIYTITIDK